MTKIIRSQFVLEDRDEQTLIENQIFDSHFPVYVDADQKVYQIRPLGRAMQRIEIDPDSLNDIDGFKFIGAAEEFNVFDVVITDTINEARPNNGVTVDGLLIKDGDVVLADGDVVKAVNGGGQIDLRAGADDEVFISSDNGGALEGWLDIFNTSAELGFGDFNTPANGLNTFLVTAAEASITVDGVRRLRANSTGLAFFNTAPVARPSGVAVNAAAIHAALVTLGLITA